MKPILNSSVVIKAGMKIRLLDGKNVDIGAHEQYDWKHPEIVSGITGKIIRFRGFPRIDWYTTDMNWEIQ